MIRLMPISEADFQSFRSRSVAEYAAEHVRTGRWSAAEALEQSDREHTALLPAGRATPDTYLYTLEDTRTGESVGLLWFAIEQLHGERTGFIYTIEIDPAYRRQGYATAAFAALEVEARRLGAGALSLHVFGHNHEAIALYTKLGFSATNITMRKSLEASSTP